MRMENGWNMMQVRRMNAANYEGRMAEEISQRIAA